MSWVDLVAGLVLLWLALAGFRNGLMAGVLSLAANFGAVCVAALLTPSAAAWGREQFDVPALLAEPAAFVALLVAGLAVAGTLAAAAVGLTREAFRRVPVLAALDHVLGPLPSLAVGVAMLAVLSLAVVALPFDVGAKRDVQSSLWGQKVLPYFSVFAPQVDEMVRMLPAPSVPTFTPNEQIGETEQLPIPENLTVRVNEADEQRMLDLLNKERATAGLKPLQLDPGLREVARLHSRDMFARRYFSHTNPDGKSPFDRMARGGVRFRAAGENLAYAPDVERAHTGLMNSPGHRANILRPEFGRVGIGVIASDGFGRMYTQNFAD